MLNLWLLLAVVGVSLMVLIWVSSRFLQGYFYTEPSPHLHWQAPAAGGLLAAFFAAWCLAVATSAEARPDDIPYNTIFAFSPNVYMVKEPVKELWAVKKNDEKIRYKRHRIDQRQYEYKDTSLAERRWNDNGVVAVELEHEGEKHVFKVAQAERGGYLSFVNDKGWIMTTGERGISGEPKIFLTSRFLANLFFNGMHLFLWFLALWLLVRFQWSHALLIGIGAWLVVTLAFLPMMLNVAAQVAQARPVPSATWLRVTEFLT